MAPWAPKSYISLSEHFRQIEAKSETEKATGRWQETQQDWETDSGIGDSPPPTPSTPITGKSFDMCQYPEHSHYPQYPEQSQHIEYPEHILVISEACNTTQAAELCTQGQGQIGSGHTRSHACMEETHKDEFQFQHHLFAIGHPPRLSELHRASLTPASPSLSERFNHSARSKTRPSTFSTFSVVGSERSPRFYEKVVRWFKKKRGRQLSSENFPTEKHSNLKHRAVVPHQVSECSISSPSPMRAKLSSTASTTSHCSSLLLPGRISPGHATKWDMSLESGYHSNSGASSPASTRSKICGSSVGSSFSPYNSSTRKFKSDRFKFISKTFKMGHTSLSEEIPENCSGMLEGVDCRVDSSWYSKSHEYSNNVVAEGKRKMFQNKPEIFHVAVDDNAEDPDSRPVSRSLSCNNSTYGSSVFSGSITSLPRSDTHEMVAITLGEFRIKHSELEFAQMIRRGPTGNIHLGKWHGDVVIHTCNPQNDEDVQSWLSDVRSLTHIRHENIVLYMGACVEPPKFAIITSPIKADSLYSHTVKGCRLSSNMKLSVLRQTANAFSYLHAKGIIHGRLSAHNIFLENKVKVSLLDYASSQLNLQYYSPEIAKQLVASSPTNPVKSKEGDVFAFGTLMYQLGTAKLPFEKLSSHALLWKVSTGQLPSLLTRSSLNGSLPVLIGKCWLEEPEQRIPFSALCGLLQPSNCISKKQSTSEPRNLDQVGKTTGLLA